MSDYARTIFYTSQPPQWVAQDIINFDREPTLDGSKGRIVSIWFGTDREKEQTLIVDKEETERLGRLVAIGAIGGEPCRLELDGLLTHGKMYWGGQSSAVKVV